MNLRHLEYFMQVVEAGSITGAAKSLRMSQPALSRQIRVLEDDLGWRLFERGAKSIRLTHAGEVVKQQGEVILKTVEQCENTMKREIDGGVIRIGYAPSLGGELLKRAISCFSQRHPQVHLQLQDCSSEEMRAKLRAGSLDLMLEVATPEDDFTWVLLNRIAQDLAVPMGHPLAKLKKKKVKVQLLEGERFLLLTRYEYPTYWKLVTGYFSSQGVNVKVAGEFDGIESLVVAIEAGLGIGFVVENTKVSDNLKVLQLDPKPDPIDVSVGWDAGKALDPMLLEFVEELKLAAKGIKNPQVNT